MTRAFKIQEKYVFKLKHPYDPTLWSNLSKDSTEYVSMCFACTNQVTGSFFHYLLLFCVRRGPHTDYEFKYLKNKAYAINCEIRSEVSLHLIKVDDDLISEVSNFELFGVTGSYPRQQSPQFS